MYIYLVSTVSTVREPLVSDSGASYLLGQQVKGVFGPESGRRCHEERIQIERGWKGGGVLILRMRNYCTATANWEMVCAR